MSKSDEKMPKFFCKLKKDSVAEPDQVFLGQPDPDQYPGKYRIRMLYPQKDPCNSNLFRYIKLSKIQFLTNIFLSFKCYKLFRFEMKMLYNIIYLA